MKNETFQKKSAKKSFEEFGAWEEEMRQALHFARKRHRQDHETSEVVAANGFL
jgi:hypothetical protein